VQQRQVRARLGIVVGAAVLLVACGSSSTGSGAPASTGGASHATSGATSVAAGNPGSAAYLVYWDQNEEEDVLSMPAGTQRQLAPPWDPNGQMCVLPDGRYVVGYDPTLPAQRNLGSAKPYKQPADGMELNEANGAFSGQTLYVPGPYEMPGQSIGSDSPPTPQGVFNDNQTYTGCAVDAAGDVFASDIATAQGDFPPPSSGRLVEWFAPNYTSSCIIYGPNTGGYGPHHTDGTGGLTQPGMMAMSDGGDVLVPDVGRSSVLRFVRSSLPTSAADCPGGLYPRQKVKVSTFVANVPFAAGVAKDPTCDCFAVSSYVGDPGIRWVTKDGAPAPGRKPVPGTPVADLGKDPKAYNPFGMAFAPDGTLYFVDIHISCKGGLADCGTTDYGGRVMKVTFHDGVPSRPVVVAGGFDFPTSVTVCIPSTSKCPFPTGAPVPPLSGPSENPAPDRGPASNAPATAGFG